MLARAHRLTGGRQFTAAVRRGRRAGSRTVAVHLVVGSQDDPVGMRVGLVVGKTVGNAVARNQVKRRLRHLLRERLDRLPSSGALVVRALPDARAATSAVLGADLDRALGRVLRSGVRS